MHGRRSVLVRMHVVPAEAGIQRLKSLDPGLKHAGMTNKWDSNAVDPFAFFAPLRDKTIAPFHSVANNLIINFTTACARCH